MGGYPSSQDCVRLRQSHLAEIVEVAPLQGFLRERERRLVSEREARLLFEEAGDNGAGFVVPPGVEAMQERAGS